MNSVFQRSNLFLLVLAIVLGSIALGAKPADAQTEADGLELTVRPGFDGIVKRNAWAPVLITLENNGASIDGELVLQVGEGETVWRTAVSLPNQSRKQLNVPVYTEGLGRPLSVRFEDENGRVILNYESGPLNGISSDDILLHAIVSPEPNSLGLDGTTGSRTGSRIAFLSIDEIPSSPIALESLDTLMFVDTDTNVLSAGQRNAIELWVQNGGQLILAGGASWQKTTAAFQDLMPVEVVGTESVSDLPEFSAAVGEPFRDAGPYVIARSSLKSGDLIWREESLPILARRPEGAGNVWFLALDPQFAPLDDWDGTEQVWESVLQYAPRQLFWERGFEDQNAIVEAVGTIPSVQLPSILLVLGFMLLYILVIGPLNYLILSRIERRELAWISLPVTMLLFSAVALIIGLQFRGNQVLVNQLSVVTGRIDDENLKVDTAIGVFSPRRATYDVTVNTPADIRHINQFAFGNLSERAEITRSDTSTRLNGVVINVGDVKPLASTTYNGVSPVSGSAILSNDGTRVELSLTNITDDVLENSLLLVGGSRQVALLDIAAGETKTRSLSLPNLSQENIQKQLAGAPAEYRSHGSTGATAASTFRDSPLENGFSTLIEGSEPGGYYDSYGVSENYQKYQLLNSLYQTYGGPQVFTPIGKLYLITWGSDIPLELDIEDTRFENRGTSLYFIEIPITN